MNVKKTLLCLRSILLSTLLSLGFFIALNVFITAVFNGGKGAGERNQTPYYIFLQIFYLLSFYLMHTRRQSKSETKPLASAFSLKENVLSYLKGEGKYFLWIYAAFALLQEVVLLLGGSSNAGPVLSILAFTGEMIFPLTYAIRIPVIRTVLTYTIVSASTIALHTFERYRLFNYWNAPSRKN